MAPPNTPSYCPICQYKYLYLGKHLENKHLIKNKAERRILINYGRGRVNIRGMSCPIEECKYSSSRVDSHLKQGHPELDAAKIQDIIKDIKICCVVDQLKALRANNPQPPMMSSLDLDSEDHEEMLVDVATTDSPCTSSSCKLVLENKRLKAELKSLRRKYKSQVRWAKKARKKIMTLEQASSSAPPEQELFQEEHSEPELHRVGLELQRQSSDLQQPSVSNEEEAPVIQQVWSLASRSSQDQKEAEHQWTEEEQMEPEPNWIKKEEEEPEPTLLKHEEIEYPLTYVRKEELDSSVLQHEQQPPEHLPTGQDQKDLCSSQEGEQLVQKQFVALIETSTLQEDDMSEEETRTEQLSLRVSPVVESKDQEGSSCSVSESQSDTGTKKRSFKCDICGKCCTQRWKLKNHYRTHTGEKPFFCHLCGKSFSQIGSLNHHKKIHTGEKPFSCQSCGKCFSQIGHLNRHKKIHTGEKPFSCQSCGKCFSQISSLNGHKTIHTGKKPFSCKLCGKNFSRISYLNYHMTVHTGKRPFTCVSCGKSFCRITRLNCHKKSHTGEK